MKVRSLKAAVAFYLESRRRLGFALESEDLCWENLVRHARQLRHCGPLINQLALNWAQVSRRQTRCGGHAAWGRCGTSALFLGGF